MLQGLVHNSSRFTYLVAILEACWLVGDDRDRLQMLVSLEYHHEFDQQSLVFDVFISLFKKYLNSSCFYLSYMLEYWLIHHGFIFDHVYAQC